MKSKQFLVLGLGRFGASLAKTLCDLGQEVLAVDADEELVNNIAPYVTQAMQLDATDETLLASLGVKNFDAAIVSIGISAIAMGGAICRSGSAAAEGGAELSS